MPLADPPQRVLPLAGATNFRDLGGYLGHDGRPVRWRRLFRSEHLAGLTPDDQAALAALGLGRAVDFRGVAERAATPYDLPGVAQRDFQEGSWRLVLEDGADPRALLPRLQAAGALTLFAANRPTLSEIFLAAVRQRRQEVAA